MIHSFTTGQLPIWPLLLRLSCLDDSSTLEWNQLKPKGHLGVYDLERLVSWVGNY